ncbi:MAG TPA: class I SAM-dependent methyltransferase [Patescibacteria group bacterium]|nr:class I SAM-dependent methyltransferase [Patescibacteria group bacterium]
MQSKFLFRTLAPQYKHPTGFLGRYVGGKMDEMNDLQNDWVLSLLSLRSTDDVLEIGFGTGKTLKKIFAKVTNGLIYGIDPSETMYKTASQLLETEIRVGRVKLFQGTIEDFPLADQKFQKISAVHVVYFWDDLAAVCSKLFRLAADGALVAVYFVSPMLSSTKVFREYSSKEIRNALIAAGFRKVEMYKKTFGPQNGICLVAKK